MYLTVIFYFHFLFLFTIYNMSNKEKTSIYYKQEVKLKKYTANDYRFLIPKSKKS